MSSFLEGLHAKAKANPKRIVFPETTDPRVLEAAQRLLASGVCKVALVGEKEELLKSGYKLDGATFYSHKDENLTKELAEVYYELRKDKGMTWVEAKRALEKPINLATLLLKTDKVDGLVSGSISPTADVFRAGIQIIRPTKGCKTVSSFFLMIMPEKKWGEDGVIAFADCAVIPDPTAEQLADITLATAENFEKLLGKEPRVAMMSYSTKGSGQGPNVDRVLSAFEIVKSKNTKGYKIDGELQADAALVSSVGSKKAPESEVAGRANVVIFPDLQSGNIGYKLVQRLAGAEAVGPITMGLAKPMNDLSRGCSVDDIVNVAVITALQS